MKIVHITERPQNKPVTRSRIGNTNDMGVAWCFGATEHLPMLTTPVSALQDVDAVIYTMSKTKYAEESRWLQLAYDFKVAWPEKKLIGYQEAEAYWPQIRPWDEQKQFYELLRVTDLFLTHNIDDEPLYKLMAGHERVKFFPSVTDLDALNGIQRERGAAVVVAAYHWRWGGIQAALTAKVGGYVVALNKAGVFTDGRDEGMPLHFDFTVDAHIPMTDWRAWATEMAKNWVYLHPMPGTAAGRDQIACACIGLPIIGNRNQTAQRVLWPDLAVAPEDIEYHLWLLKKLEEPEFYSECVRQSKSRVHEFGIDAGLEKAKTMIAEMGWAWEWRNQ